LTVFPLEGRPPSIPRAMVVMPFHPMGPRPAWRCHIIPEVQLRSLQPGCSTGPQQPSETPKPRRDSATFHRSTFTVITTAARRYKGLAPPRTLKFEPRRPDSVCPTARAWVCENYAAPPAQPPNRAAKPAFPPSCTPHSSNWASSATGCGLRPDHMARFVRPGHQPRSSFRYGPGPPDRPVGIIADARRSWVMSSIGPEGR